MNQTGKRARKRYGNRYAAKRHSGGNGKGQRKKFGHLPVSVAKGNAQQFVLSNSGMDVSAPAVAE